ncbi:MAG: right-handed parallel beta-helix repeat-containing protein [Hyphomonadaceae bacterium]|nr:right-handed parallel beta-helix repeat-containing protein [Hyphomonadaceae bacterium]
MSLIGILTASTIPLFAAAHDQVPIKILTDQDVIDQHYLPDFSYAGYKHGMEDIPVLKGKVIDVTKYGVTADDEIDDSIAMLKALKEAHNSKSPVVVQLPKGKIIISEILKIQRSDIVLRGAGSGADGTNLHFPRPLEMIDKTDSLDELRRYLKKYDKRHRPKDKNIDVLFSEYSWSGGFIWIQKEGTRAASYLESEDPEIIAIAQALRGKVGTQTVTVDTAQKLNVGDVLELQWFNRQGEGGALIKEMYGDTDLKVGSHHWTFKTRPLVRQKTEILAVSGNTVTISDPLLHNISEDLPAQFSSWDHITNVGIEDLHLSFPNSPYFGHHMERGYNGIYLTSVFNGWVRDVSVHNGDTGILTYNSANVTISNIETTGDRRAHYSVHAGNVHNMLVQNLTVNNPAIHSLSLNTQSTKCVFKNAIVNEAAVLDQHAGANHQNLFDNVTVHIAAKRDKNGPYYPIWDGSGAGYWQPGHGRFSTTWNLKVNVLSGADRIETVELRGTAEGPNARVVGVHGNRDFKINYVPAPYMERTNSQMNDVPSLYDYQLGKRLQP